MCVTSKHAAHCPASGLSRRTIGAYLAGETDPKRVDFIKLARAGGVSVGWLADNEQQPQSSNTLEQPRAGYVYLPLKEVEAAAGGGSFIDSERVVDVLAFKEEWIRQELHARPGDLDLIYVKGDSMEPDLRAGDIILLDHTDTRASREGVYVIKMDGALLVKQLQRLPGGVVKVITAETRPTSHSR